VRWRLVCRKADKPAPLKGQIALAEFALHRAASDPPRPGGDPDQDEVWLRDGDQLFGSVARADRRAVVLDGRFGKRTLPWTALRGISLKRGLARRPPRAARVRVWVENGDGPPDELEGTVLSLDERRCRLRHAELGEVVFERGRLSRIQWLP
jgi:hypothetical protein